VILREGKSVNLIIFDCVESCILAYVHSRIFVIEWELQKCKFDTHTYIYI